MSRLDSTAAAALDQQVIRPVWLIWLDIVGDQIRANSSGHDVSISASGDSELDGTFIGVSADLLSVSDVSFKVGGSEPVEVTLSGIPTVDDDDLAVIGDASKWRGRTARLWRYFFNESGDRIGGIQAFYTGYINSMLLKPGVETQTIQVNIESYLASLTAPSNRTYLDQHLFDPGDLSGRATPAVANGTPDGGRTPPSRDFGIFGSGGGRGSERLINA